MAIISIEVNYIKMAQVLYQLFYVGANVRKLIVLGTSYLYVLGTIILDIFTNGNSFTLSNSLHVIFQ